MEISNNGLIVESVLLNGFSSIIRNVLLPEITKYLAATRGVSISVDELSKCLALPSTTSSLTPNNLQTPVNAFQNMNMGSSLTQAPKITTTNKKKPVSNPNLPQQGMGTTCIYIYTRGENKGTNCPNKPEPGSPFCKQCGNKKTAGTQLQNAGRSNIQGGPAPGIHDTLGSNRSSTNNGSLILKDLHNGFYAYEQNNLAFKFSQPSDDPGSYICVGLFNNDRTKLLPLTNELIKFCNENDISYVDPSNERNNSAPQIPIQQNINNIQQKISIPFAQPNTLINKLPQSGQHETIGIPGSVGSINLPGFQNNTVQIKIPSIQSSNQQPQILNLPGFQNNSQIQGLNFPGTQAPFNVPVLPQNNTDASRPGILSKADQIDTNLTTNTTKYGVGEPNDDEDDEDDACDNNDIGEE